MLFSFISLINADTHMRVFTYTFTQGKPKCHLIERFMTMMPYSQEGKKLKIIPDIT